MISTKNRFESIAPSKITKSIFSQKKIFFCFFYEKKWYHQIGDVLASSKKYLLCGEFLLVGEIVGIFFFTNPNFFVAKICPPISRLYRARSHQNPTLHCLKISKTIFFFVSQCFSNSAKFQKFHPKILFSGEDKYAELNFSSSKSIGHSIGPL